MSSSSLGSPKSATAKHDARNTRVLARISQQWAVFAGCVLVWQLVSGAVQSPFFPTPLTILTHGYQRWFSGSISSLLLTDSAYHDIVPSVSRLLLGWLLAALIGIGFGLLLGRSKNLMAYFGPLLAFARSIPPPALIPVFLVLFQLGFRMQLATIVFGSVWPILLNSAEGARTVDATKTDTARAFRISRPQWIVAIVLPTALPKLFAGLRISLSLALVMMVVSELVGATNGLGHAMRLAREEFNYTQLWSGLVLLGVLGFCLNAALSALEKRVVRSTHHTTPASG